MPSRLDDVQSRALSALCSRIVPHADSATLAEAVETRLATGDATLARQVALLLTVFDHPVTSLAAGLRIGRFSSWPAAQQDAWLARWEASALPPMRTIFQAFRRLVLSTCYASPSEYAGIGFRGPLYDRDAVVAWEGALPGSSSDAETVLRVPDARLVRGAHRDAAAEWVAANRVPAGVVQGHEITGERRITADVCVVGTGAGGAVVAARLAERGLDVVMLEEGGYWTASDFTEHEAEMVPRLWADAGARATDDLSLSVFQGRAVGGSTTINWMIMLRAADAVLDEWADEHGMEGMQGSAMAAAYDRVERDVHARVVPGDAHAPHNSIILDGAAKLGWHARAAANNAKGCVRAGFCGIGCRYGAKQGTLVTYVPRALAAGARLYSDARVDTVSQQGGGGKRVHATVLDRTTSAPRGALIVDARIVVLSAGAVGTPAILQRSGMGGGGVGKYLRVHPTTAIVGRYEREMYSAAGIPQSALCDHFMRGAGNAHGFWIESPALLPGLASVALPGFGAAHRETMRAFPRLSSLIALVRDGADRGRSNGSVRVDRAGRPHITHRLGDADRATLLRGIEASARLHFAAGASEVMTLHSPLLRLSSESQLAEIARRASGPNQLALFSAHMNGTCRIGRDVRTSGCGPDGHRHGVRGLYVVDGSLFPTAPGVNPQHTIMAMAHLLSDRIALS